MNGFRISLLGALVLHATAWSHELAIPIPCGMLPTSEVLNEALSTHAAHRRRSPGGISSPLTHIPRIPHQELTQLRELISPPVGKQAHILLASYRGETVVVRLFPTKPYQYLHPGVIRILPAPEPSEVRAQRFAQKLLALPESETIPKLMGTIQLHDHQFAVVISYPNGKHRLKGAYQRAALLKDEILLPLDFKHSPKRFDSGAHPVSGFTPYPAWAAETANKAIHLLKERISLRDVLFFIADARNSLAAQMGDDTNHFGISRRMLFSSQSSTYLGLEPIIFTGKQGMVQELQTALMEKALSRGLMDRALYEGITLHELYEPNHYLTLSGESIPATYLAKAGPVLLNLSLNHPSIHQAEHILSDVFRRLEIARTQDPDVPKTTRLTHFLIAMFGYYNALPYIRGSASIGHVFFQAFFHSYFGGKLSTKISQEYIDFLAMMDDQDEFVARFLFDLLD